MFIFGHLGIGTALVTAARRKMLNPPAIFLAVSVGTLLPDLLDKSLYYGLVWFTGRRGIELGIWSGTRTIGHSLLFAVLILAVGMLLNRRKSMGKWIIYVGLGVVTHLLLDQVSNLFNSLYEIPGVDFGNRSPVPPFADLFWPFLGWQFPVTPFSGEGDHAASILRIHTLAFEIVGAALLIYQYTKRRL